MSTIKEIIIKWLGGYTKAKYDKLQDKINNIDNNNIDTFNPSTTNCNIYRVGEYIDQYVKRYAGGSKRNLIFKVRISLDNPKHTKWM